MRGGFSWLVRSTFDFDFTEVWIDDAIVEQERGYIRLHELHDALAAEGWT
jgi:hypothetical protein